MKIVCKNHHTLQFLDKIDSIYHHLQLRESRYRDAAFVVFRSVYTHVGARGSSLGSMATDMVFGGGGGGVGLLLITSFSGSG